MRLVNGWYLPSDDKYFDKFIEGLPPKENGFQREHLLEAFKYVDNWDYAVDVGAHVGLWAKDMADRFDKVYCFEPSPQTYGCLAKNMATYDNVVLSMYALGQRDQLCKIVRDSDRPTNSGSEFVEVSREGQLRMTSLDRLDLPGCDLLKIDVEGYEFGVLVGAKQTIQKYRPVVIMECNKKFSRRFGWQDSFAPTFLLKRGYKEMAHMRPDKVFAPV